jgi:hypothetical protein
MTERNHENHWPSTVSKQIGDENLCVAIFLRYAHELLKSCLYPFLTFYTEFSALHVEISQYFILFVTYLTTLSVTKTYSLEQLEING